MSNPTHPVWRSRGVGRAHIRRGGRAGQDERAAIGGPHRAELAGGGAQRVIVLASARREHGFGPWAVRDKQGSCFLGCAELRLAGDGIEGIAPDEVEAG